MPHLSTENFPYLSPWQSQKYETLEYGSLFHEQLNYFDFTRGHLCANCSYYS